MSSYQNNILLDFIKSLLNLLPVSVLYRSMRRPFSYGYSFYLHAQNILIQSQIFLFSSLKYVVLLCFIVQ